jgi:hypothetical protein
MVYLTPLQIAHNMGVAMASNDRIVSEYKLEWKLADFKSSALPSFIRRD